MSKRRRTARDRLIERNLGLVGPIARRIHQRLPASFDLLDLVSAGTLGLIQAAERCNLSQARNRAAMFTSYARARIQGAIYDSVRRGAFIASTHEPIEAAEREYVEPEAPKLLESAETARAVWKAFRSLPADQARLLYSHYWSGMPLEGIGAEMGLGPSATSRLHRRALEALRSSLPIRLLEKAA